VKSRVLTALVLIPIVLAVMMSASPWPLFALAAVLAGAAYKELGSFGAQDKAGIPVAPVLLFAGFGVYSIIAPGFIPILQLVALSIFGLVIAPSYVNSRSKVLLEAASCWCVAPLLCLCLLQTMYASPGKLWEPAAPILVIVLPIWIGDSLAYFIGKKFGKHLLAPGISPKKTIEGAVANLLGCVGGAIAVGVAIGLPLWISVACGLIAGTFGQAGDLYESSLKRVAGIKDAGTILPGHGGVLDRIDSLLAAAPLQALLLAGFWPTNISR
jgi:phosphatidate cytidylyltransferase